MTIWQFPSECKQRAHKSPFRAESLIGLESAFGKSYPDEFKNHFYFDKYTKRWFFVIMAARCANRKRYKKRPGLAQAARELGVTYSHARRVMLGERPTSLREKLNTLLEQHRPTPKSPTDQMDSQR